VLPRFDLHETLQVIQDFRLGRLWMVNKHCHNIDKNFVNTQLK
jgi:hypothetical protein